MVPPPPLKHSRWAAPHQTSTIIATLCTALTMRTSVMDSTQFAETQFAEHLQQNPYPGRGLVIGRTAADGWVQIYWIMGRSARSQNRRFVINHGTLRTEARDPTIIPGPSLIIYEAMLESPGQYLVGNGDHTRTLTDTLQAGGTFEDALLQREREPDAPHYTPRIMGLLTFEDRTARVVLGILKVNPANPVLTDRFSYRPAPPPVGFGVGLTTYTGDGTPLPSFRGDPLLLPCHGSVEAILHRYWDALNPAYRIAIAVKTIMPDRRTSTIIVKERSKQSAPF
jgi:IMP cyclohydrolase